jgi:hypothetical protein
MKVKYRITESDGLYDITKVEDGVYTGMMYDSELNDILALQLQALQLTSKTQRILRALWMKQLVSNT